MKTLDGNIIPHVSTAQELAPYLETVANAPLGDNYIDALYAAGCAVYGFNMWPRLPHLRKGIAIAMAQYMMQYYDYHAFGNGNAFITTDELAGAYDRYLQYWCTPLCYITEYMLQCVRTMYEKGDRTGHVSRIVHNVNGDMDVDMKLRARYATVTYTQDEDILCRFIITRDGAFQDVRVDADKFLTCGAPMLFALRNTLAQYAADDANLLAILFAPIGMEYWTIPSFRFKTAYLPAGPWDVDDDGLVYTNRTRLQACLPDCDVEPCNMQLPEDIL